LNVDELSVLAGTDVMGLDMDDEEEEGGEGAAGNRWQRLQVMNGLA
jgi:hypothetical protein